MHAVLKCGCIYEHMMPPPPPPLSPTPLSMYDMMLLLSDAVMQQATDQEMITMTQNQLYGVRTAEEDIKMEPVYETLEEKMEMTQN